MRRTNLHPKPTETLDAESITDYYANGSFMSLRPGQYVASCDVTHSEVEDVKVTFWANHTQVGTGNGAIGANVMRIDLQSDSTPCLFAVRKCRATDFIVERADTHALASGGGFRASSPRRPRRTSLEAGDRR